MGNINWLFMFPTILVETKSSVRMAATPCKLMYDFTPALVLSYSVSSMALGAE